MVKMGRRGYLMTGGHRFMGIVKGEVRPVGGESLGVQLVYSDVIRGPPGNTSSENFTLALKVQRVCLDPVCNRVCLQNQSLFFSDK